ncbi:MAG: flavin reductase family protein [Thermoleophilia bacterium]|nr:flavin reductase family protein [Thermoleophilia bacterium]
MNKIKLGPRNSLYPSLTTLVGTVVDGRPNFITIAHVGIMTMKLISFGIGKSHYSNQGIRENGCFSVNIPSEELVVKTDYCGLVSGRKEDKSALFDIFSGELEGAPMISECPINMECRLERTIETPTHDVFVGEVMETYVNENLIEADKVDISQLKPLLFDMSSRKYWSLGPEIAKCWSVGNELKGTEE